MMAVGRRKDDLRDPADPDDRLPERKNRRAEHDRRDERSEAARDHLRKPMRRSTACPAKPMRPTSTADSAAPTNNAAQICTVCP